MISNELLPINVAGEWRLGGGGVYESLYPATGEPFARLKAASLADVDTVVAAPVVLGGELVGAVYGVRWHWTLASQAGGPVRVQQRGGDARGVGSRAAGERHGFAGRHPPRPHLWARRPR